MNKSVFIQIMNVFSSILFITSLHFLTIKHLEHFRNGLLLLGKQPVLKSCHEFLHYDCNLYYNVTIIYNSHSSIQETMSTFVDPSLFKIVSKSIIN